MASEHSSGGAPRYRPLQFGVRSVVLRDGAPGVRYLESDLPLAPHAERLTDRLLHWASTTPERSFMARRAQLPDGSTGEWQHLSYAQALAAARSIGQALLQRGLNAERPVVILSENSLEHAQLALACLIVGIPYCAVSPAYSTISRDYDKLHHIFKTLTPGLVFATDAARYGRAIAAVAGADVEVVLQHGHGDAGDVGAAAPELAGRNVVSFDSLRATPVTDAVDAARQATGPDTITKFLFTSGSTKMPKAVVNTHRMWCANQMQMVQSIPALGEGPPVLVDWLPWSHTFGANHNVGIALYHGGTMYIDDGKPTPAAIGETLRNLREIAPTVYFNVPTGFEFVANAMKEDPQLRKNLLSRVKLFYYAGAALAQSVWDTLHEVQEQELGERVVMATGLGMTESSPAATFVNTAQIRTGDVGVPSPGLTLKLIDVDGKIEVRYRGPNITPAYWRDAASTAEAFDDEGFFCTGDAVAWIDPDDIHRGLRFDGRIAEDFKLATGTFVSVGPMRGKIVAAGAPYIQDAVLTGLNLKEVGALLFPTEAIRGLAGLAPDAPWQAVVQSQAVQARMQQLVDQLAAQATGSASRIARAHLEFLPPSVDLGEATDKGSLNQRAVLRHRAATVDALHNGSLPFTIVPSNTGV
jgi:feruloyl-CoA synthase